MSEMSVKLILDNQSIAITGDLVTVSSAGPLFVNKKKYMKVNAFYYKRTYNAHYCGVMSTQSRPAL